jgi:hypothetical protein
VNAPGTTSAADNAAAEAALRNLDAAFIGLYNLLVFHGEKPDTRPKFPYRINRIFPTRKASG